MDIRAKMRCEKIVKGDDYEVVDFEVVTADSEENKQWAKYTPSGSLSLTIDNPEAQGAFTLKDEYFVDITPVPAKE